MLVCYFKKEYDLLTASTPDRISIFYFQVSKTLTLFRLNSFSNCEC